jgi:hypothetical protein
MARVIVMPNAANLEHGVSGRILFAEKVDPTKLEDVQTSLEFLERLERAIIPAARPQPRS